MLAHHEPSNTAPRIRTMKAMAFRLSLCFALLALLLSPAFAATPKQDTVMGPEEETKSINVTVWLNLHNKAALDTLVEEMYDPSSANYHHFLTMKEYQEQFAPSAKDMAQVHAFLAAHNM